MSCHCINVVSRKRFQYDPFHFFLVQELSTLHDRHLNRPTLDDSVDEEQTIEITTKEITQVKGHFKY